MEQYNQHEKYYVHKVSDDLWWVFRRVDKVGVNGLPVPMFKRVREVKLVGEHLSAPKNADRQDRNINNGRRKGEKSWSCEMAGRLVCPR